MRAIVIEVHSLSSINELNQRRIANMTMELGNPNATLGWMSSVIFVQHKEKCHLFSLWIIIHMDTKLQTTQCKQKMFLSLL